MKKTLILLTAMLLPWLGLQADLRFGTLTPDLDALTKSLAGESDEDSPHRSKELKGETRLDLVDVLVAYDKSAQGWLADNHRGTVNDFAVKCIEKANYCLIQSNISEFRFRLVGVVAVDVDVSDVDFATLLCTQFVSTSGEVVAKGELKKITDARNAFGADIVSVLVRQNTIGQVGLGYSCTYPTPTAVTAFWKWAYNVCSIEAVDSGYAMVHEIGHNMGCGHPDASLADPAYVSSGPQSSSYSAGYYFWKDGAGYHTVMAYNYGGINEAGDGYYGGTFTSLPMFSSPELAYEGHPVGDSAHDNRRVLLDNYKYVAQFMVSKADGEVTPDSAPDMSKPTPITWCTSWEEAMAAAAGSGKRILMVSGRDDCGNTQAVKDAIEHDPEANKQAANFVCWYDLCELPESGFFKYCTFYGSVSLPYVCVVDSAIPDAVIAQNTGYLMPSQLATFLNDASKATKPVVPDARIAVSMPVYQSEFTYDGKVKQSLLSVCEDVEVEGTWAAVQSGSYSYTLTLPDTSVYKWMDGTDAPITVNWKIKADEKGFSQKSTDGEIVPGHTLPALFNGEPSAPFAGGVTYNGWLRGGDGALQGTVTVKAAKPGRDGNSKLTVAYTPFGQRKQTIRTVAAAGGNPVVSIPGVGSIKLGGEALAGVDVKLQAAPDLSKTAASKAAYLAALSAKVGTWTFAFNTDHGYAAFSVTVDKKGKGKLTGTLPDGVKVSLSSQGALGGNGLAIPFAFAKKGKLGFVFWIKNGGTAEISDVTKLQTASAALTVKSWTAPSSTKTLADGNCTFVCGTTVQDFTVAGRKWTFARNDTKLKLSFTQKTGIVKGNFRVGRTKYTVNGVVVGSLFYGSAYVKGQKPLMAWTK